MLAAMFWGLVGGIALLLGAVLGLRLRTSSRLIGIVMAFGAGVLVSALAFELTREAFERGGATAVVLGLGAGALCFFVGDLVIDRRGGDNRKRSGGQFFLAAAGVGGANPPLDAARLDIVHSRLWGRAEAVRTVVRTALEAPAPLLFGWLSTQLGGRGGGLVPAVADQPAGAVGLDRTFLVMLVPLLAAAALLLVAGRRSYPRDAATALASDPHRPAG